MRLLFFDVETTGEDPAKCQITELGWALYESNTRKMLACGSRLVWEEGREVPGEGAVTVNGIDEALLREGGTAPGAVFKAFNKIASESDAIVAHNGFNFDDRVVQRELESYGLKFDRPNLIDTLYDLPFPKHLTSRNLTFLAGFLGFANPFAHRALPDVLTLIRVTEELGIEETIKSSESALGSYAAVVSFADKEKAKALKYNWDPDAKTWWKTGRVPKLEAEAKEAEVKIRPIPLRFS